MTNLGKLYLGCATIGSIIGGTVFAAGMANVLGLGRDIDTIRNRKEGYPKEEVEEDDDDNDEDDVLLQMMAAQNAAVDPIQ